MGSANSWEDPLAFDYGVAIGVPQVEIVAHRGASIMAPENTLAAARLAWQQGCDAVEIDVHVSRDKRIMAIYDPSTRRTAGRNWPVAKTHSTRLRQLHVGRSKEHLFAHERIPFLTEVLEGVPQDGRLFIDIKCGEEIVPLLQEELDRSGKRDQVVVIAFALEVLQACKREMPDVPAYWLRETWLRKPHRRILIDRALAAGIDGLDVQWSGVTAGFARSVKDSGLDFYVWTVDRLPTARRLVRLGVEGITTNDPGLYRGVYWADEPGRDVYETSSGVLLQ